MPKQNLAILRFITFPVVMVLFTATTFFWPITQSICAQTNGTQLFHLNQIAGRDVSALQENKKSSLAAVREQGISVQATAADLQKSERLTLPLFNEQNYEVRRNEAEGLEVRSSEDVTWRGKIVGQPDSSVTLTLKNGVLSGSLFTSEGLYEIVGQSGNRQVLAEINQNLYPDCGGAVQAKKQPTANFSSTPSMMSSVVSIDSPSQIDVLVVYTDDARGGAGGTANIQSLIQQAIDATNTAYANSRVYQRVRLVHTAEVNYNEGGNANTDLEWVRNNNHVRGLRDQYRADVVSLIVNRSNFCGLGYLMTDVNENFAANAYSVVLRSCALGELALAHELGHNMGAHHNPENAGGTPAFSYSYGHYVNGLFRTVMSYDNQCTLGCPRIPYFSHPYAYDAAWNPTGLENERDNARTFNNTALTVANFRTQPTSNIPNGRTIALKAVFNGKYVTADNWGWEPLSANRDWVGGEWEKFIVRDIGNGEVALQALANGKYVHVEDGGYETPLIASADSITRLEAFRWIDYGSGQVALYASHLGVFVSSDNEQDRLYPNRGEVYDAIKFVVEFH